MFRNLKGIAIAALAAAIVAPAAGAQRTRTASKPAPRVVERASKWVFGAHVVAAPGVSVTGADIEGTWGTGMGGGLGVMAGYDINKSVTGFASLDVARQPSGVNYMTGSFGLVHAELGLRAVLSKANPQMMPYATAAVGKRAVGARVTDLEDGELYEISLSGTMLSFGGGLSYRMSPKMSFDGGVELGLGAFNHVDDDGDLYTINVNSSSSIRVRAGLIWRP
jgi:hypothetical protein